MNYTVSTISTVFIMTTWYTFYLGVLEGFVSRTWPEELHLNCGYGDSLGSYRIAATLVATFLSIHEKKVEGFVNLGV